ncbi:DNA-directed primase/polymerase protein isoform X2 [Magallana gigas]|uniref:DNA-directed primase/polymerase protein isoform X2 n=1 Tax=Magallana gigas TaxID=29159 RepID=UPI003341923C
MSTITRNLFYGVSNKTALRKRKLIGKCLDEKVKDFEHYKIPKDYKQRITGPVVDWKLFYRQQSAFNYARDQSEELHVIAFESSSVGFGDGKRMYLVSSYDVFWNYYKQLSSEKKLHYEIIPEGAVCKLYFDLEFSIPDNPDNNGTEMVAIFIQYVCLWLEEEFNVKCSRKDVLDLEASTDKKFSRHLIFLIPDVAFQDNVTIGCFVHHIIEELNKYCESSDSPKVENRLSLDSCTSSKKNSVTNACLGNQINSLENCESAVEDASCCGDDGVLDNVRKKSQISDRVLGHFTKEQLSSLIVRNKHGEKASFCDMGVYTKNRNFRLYLSRKYGKNNPLLVAAENEFVPLSSMNDEAIFMDSLIANVKFSSRMKILKSNDTHRRSQRSFSNKGASSTEHVRKLEPYGGIRHWTYFSQGELIVYEMANYRFCHNVERSHKSNNVMFVVDLKKKIYYQKCHDPVCKSQGFKSSDFPLPESVFPSFLWEDDPMFDGEDEDLCSAAEDIEKTLPL